MLSTKGASTLLEPQKALRTTIIDLRSQNLAEAPPQLFRLSNLQTAMLIDNQLTELPPEIGQLTELRTLHVFSIIWCSVTVAFTWGISVTCRRSIPVCSASARPAPHPEHAPGSCRITRSG